MGRGRSDVIGIGGKTMKEQEKEGTVIKKGGYKRTLIER